MTEISESELNYPPKKPLVVFNPGAGMTNPISFEQRIRQMVETKGFPYQIHRTCSEESVSQLVKEAVNEGFDLIIAAGGDGTVSQVASGVAGTHVPMGVVPCGTGNIIAKDLRIPLHLNEAVDLIFSPKRRVIQIDAMKVEGEYYILIVSAGFSAYVFKHINRDEKRRLGIFSYLLKGLLQLAGIQPIHFELDVDGQEFRFSASDVLITNSALIGWYPLKLNPDIRMDDGKLSICILRARNLIDFFKIGWNIVLSRQRTVRELAFIDVQQMVEVSANRILPVQGDGDIIGATPFRLEFFPKLVNFIVPENYDGPRDILGRTFPDLNEQVRWIKSHVRIERS